MRLYLAGDRASLETLRDGGSVTLPAYAAASTGGGAGPWAANSTGGGAGPWAANSTGGGAGPWAANSTDEEDEFAALSAAAEESAVVVVADVDEVDAGDDQTVVLEQVDALHVDVDGSGDLAWFATQEIDEVMRLLA